MPTSHRISRLFIFLILATALISCHKAPPSSLVTIDIDEALKTSGELRLSAIASDVDFIALHGMGTDTYVHNWSWQYFIGQKVICVFNVKPYEFLLFRPDGTFIRKIGTAGKGPGEFIGQSLVYKVDEENETILIADNSLKKFILFRFSGELISERSFKDYHSISLTYIVGITTAKKGEYVVKNSVEPSGTNICYEILVLDSSLKLVSCIKQEIPGKGPYFLHLDSNPVYRFGKNIRFWNPDKDTVYEIINNQPHPVYHLLVADQPNADEKMYSGNKGHIVTDKILETGSTLLIAGSKGDKPFYLAHDKTTGKTTRIFCTGKCGMAENIGIENDLFGFSPFVLTESTTICNDRLLLVLPPSYIDYIDEWLKGKLTDCLRSKEVLLPAKRDELVRIIEKLDENSGPILMSVKLK